MIGCECPVCNSPDTRNVRTRSSIILGLPEGNLLIDTGPELRIQLLREHISAANAILITHDHVDHLYGLDETRIFSRTLNGESVSIYCDQRVKKAIYKKFDYVFAPDVQNFPAGGIPKLIVNTLEPYVPVQILGAEVIPLSLIHGITTILGFRIGNFAYCTDVKLIPPESMEHLYGLETLVLGCLRYRPHYTHMNVSEALETVRILRPQRTLFTHIAHDLDHATFCAELPPDIAPAYDGLRLKVKLL